MRVVIVGGGFAAVQFAKTLRKKLRASECGFDDPPGEKILHEHIRMQIRPRYAAIAKICFN